MTWFSVLMGLLILGGTGAVGYAFYGKKSGPTHCIGCGKCVADGKCVLYGTPVRGPRQKMAEKGAELP